MLLLVGIETAPLIYLALGLTVLGIFSKYKMFSLLALGPIFFLLFEYAVITDPHEGVDIMLVGLAAWSIVNIYIALFGGSND